MYFKIKCPHCEKSLKVREELAGRKCACPYCKGSVRIPKEPEPAPEEATEAGFPNLDLSVAPKSKGRGGKPPAGKAPDKPKEKREQQAASSSAGAWTDSSNVSLTQSGLIGAGASVVFLLLLLPFHKSMLGQLFWHRGWVPFVLTLTLLLFWSLAILVLKWRKLKRQRESMLLDVLPIELSKEITLDSLDQFEEHVHGLPGEPGESFLINRVIRGLEHFRVRKNAAETVTMMESQSAIDANTVASSYAILKVFIWALPIMGFIGTVIGVSAAVASLGGSLESASDISVIKDSLNDVFAGLGTAFDTTLLALVLSLFVKIPASALQKNEEDLVTWVDEYCNENLLKRLNDGQEGGGGREPGESTDSSAVRSSRSCLPTKTSGKPRSQRWDRWPANCSRL
jgi:biopolymer transport protein ExbB/TolQ/phage FluMu protein Com